MKDYFILQFVMTNRKIKEAGISPLLGYLFGLTAFVLLSEYIFHKSHIHSRSGNCPLDRDGHIGVKLFKRVPALYITRISPKCKEVDQDWLKTFEKCCLHVIGRSRIPNKL